MATKAYIKSDHGKGNSVPLIADKSLHWEQSKGIIPHQVILNTTPEFKDDIIDMSNGVVSLVIDHGEASLEVKKLYILDFPSPPNPRYFSFVLSDFRWIWPYSHFVKRYNIPRHIGYKRVPAPNLELAEVVEEVYYKRYSLKDPTKNFPLNKWTPEDALKDVLGSLAQYEVDMGRPLGGKRKVIIDRHVAGALKDIPLEKLEIDDSGDMAVARLISRLPMANLYVDNNGDIQVYSTLSGGDVAMVESLGPEVFRSGHIEFVDNRNTRPSKVHVLFTKEIEVRFDAQNEPEVSVGKIGEGYGDDIPASLKPSEKGKIHLLENVLPIPDYQLKVTINPDQAFGGDTNVTLPQGTWISFHQALNAWADSENLDKDPAGDAIGRVWPFLAEGVNLDWGFIRKAMVPWNDLWSGLASASERFPNALWAARMMSIPIHWRRTYRIPNEWVDGAYAINSYRISTVDQETGTRAPSMLYSDYCIAHTTRNIFKGIDLAGGGGGANGKGHWPTAYWEIEGYPRDGTFVIHPDHESHVMGIIGDSAKPAPATIDVVDEDQGIIRIDWKPDPFKTMDLIIPGMLDKFEDTANEEEHVIDGQNIRDWARGGTPRGWNWVTAENMRINRVTRDAAQATILTMIPAAPNNTTQFHRIEVTPEDVEKSKMVPAPAMKGIKNALGPELYVRVGPGTATARFAWKDTAEHAKKTRLCFGVESSPDAEAFGLDLPAREDEMDFNDGTLINKGDAGNDNVIAHVDELKGPNIDNIALAVAAKVYTGFADKLSGQVDGTLNPDIQVDGFIGSVAHSVDPSGGAFSNIMLTEPIPEIDIFSLLDESSRNQIMRLVQHK